MVCEDCTLAAPDNAVQILFPSKFIRLKLKDCRLMALNFSQPHGTPSSGVISTIVADPRQVHVDFEDGLLMGFKLFGNTNPEANKPAGAGTNEITYTTKGKVQAYVQFRQPTPSGFERLGLWPVEAFRTLDPRWPKAAVPAAAGPATRPKPPAVPGDPSRPGYTGRNGRDALRVQGRRQLRRQQLAEGVPHDPGGAAGRARQPGRTSRRHPAGDLRGGQSVPVASRSRGGLQPAGRRHRRQPRLRRHRAGW